MKKVKKFFDSMIVIAMVCGGLALGGGAIYGVYWIGKTFSYSFFYEDMVQKTVTQMVKPEALK